MEGLGNLPAVVNLVNKQNPTIVALQETWLRSYRNVRVTDSLQNYSWTFKNADTQIHPEDQIVTRNMSYHGTAIGIRKDISESTSEVKVEHRNIAASKIVLNDVTLIAASLYLPTGNHDDQFEEAVDALATTLEDFPDDRTKVILIGDLNIDTNHSVRRKNKWKDFLQSHSLTDNRTGRPTHFHKPTGTNSELDRVVTRNIVPTIEHLRDNLLRSSHIPVVANFQIESRQQEESPKGGLIETKVNISALDDRVTEFQELTKHLADYLKTEREKFSLDTQNGVVSSLIFQAAIMVTGQEIYQSQKEKKPRRLKIDKTLYNDLRKATREHRRSRDKGEKLSAARKVKFARKKIAQAMEARRNQESLEIHRKIIRAANSQSAKIFGLLKKLKQAQVVENKIPSVIEGYGQRFETPHVLSGLRELFKLQTTIDFNDRFDEQAFQMAKEAIESRTEIEWEEEEYQAIEISREEFGKVIDKLKTEKAQDYLGLSNDLLKRVHPDMISLLHEISADCLRSRDYGGLVRNYGKGTIIVKKPGKPVTSVKNWRKIVVNPTLGNITQVYVQPSIEKKSKAIQTNLQLGFTEGVPIMNAVILREEIQNISISMKKTLFFGVLDLASCFPRISREQMLLLASEILTPSEWDLLNQIYRKTWGEIRIEGQRSEPMEGNIGSIEGGLLSVQILKIFISVLLVLLIRAGYTAKVDFAIMKLRAGGVGVADDVLLFAWSPGAMREMLRICQYWSDRYRATFSPDKSVIVIQRTKGDVKDYGTFQLNGENLQVVSIAEHLGVPISETADNSKELIVTRIEKTRRAVMGTLSIFDPKSFINISTRLELWRKQYRAIMTYALETAKVKIGQMKKLESFQLKMLKGMIGLSKRASGPKTRLLAGATSIYSEVWKTRFGALNNVLVGNTITRQFIVLAWHCRLEKTWTVTTIRTLQRIIESEGIGDKIEAVTTLMNKRQNFKEDMKNLMHGVELRKITGEVETETYKIPQTPFKTSMPMMCSDFSQYGKKLVNMFAAVYTNDFFRNFNKRCFLCMNKSVNPRYEHLYRDDSDHLLSNRCIVNNSTMAQEAWSDFKEKLCRIQPNNIILSEVVSERYRIRFMLNPTCLSLGQNSVKTQDLQGLGMDVALKKYFYFKLKFRYKLLKEGGFITKKRIN